MSCRRALEIDLAAMMRGEDGPDQQEFRSHYPRCRECAAEVHAWSAVHGLLTATAIDAHPNPKKLLWFVDRPQSLSTVDRDRITAHVADCRSCRDEMATLKGLDLHALTRPLAVMKGTPTPPPRPAPTPVTAVPWWHTVGWPRLAFVVVAMGLVPLLTSRFGPQQPPALQPAPIPIGAGPARPTGDAASRDEIRADRQEAPAQNAAPSQVASDRAPAESQKAKAESPAPDAPPRRQPAAAKPAADAGKLAAREFADRAAPPPPPAAAPAEEMRTRAKGGLAADPPPGTRGFESESAPADGAPALLAPRRAPAEGAAADPRQTLGRSGAGAAPAVGAAPSDDERDTDGASAGSDAPAAGTPRVVSLHRAGTVHVTADGNAPLTIVTPAHLPAAGETDAEVRIVDAGQRRELRQQGTLSDGALTTTVTGGWLTPGEYQVEVRVGGVLTIYRLTVDR